jgi:hypothetical protein
VHNLGFALDSAWRILIVCLVLGAGLPALFALGIRALAHGGGGDPEVDESGVSAPVPHPAATIAGYACFAIAAVAVLLGIAFIVASGAGKTLSFEHVWPTITAKG